MRALQDAHIKFMPAVQIGLTSVGALEIDSGGYWTCGRDWVGVVCAGCVVCVPFFAGAECVGNVEQLEGKGGDQLLSITGLEQIRRRFGLEQNAVSVKAVVRCIMMKIILMN